MPSYRARAPGAAIRRGTVPALLSAMLAIAGCATQAPPVASRESAVPPDAQRQAQKQVTQAAPAAPTLKRKIALGRISNETNYGHSLVRSDNGDPVGKQVTDLLSKALAESGAFIVFERPDLGQLKAESTLTGAQMNLVGVDALVIGSLTEFGRKVVGQTGFASQSKKQVSFAKVDLRLVDTVTGQVFFATSGAGEASTETSSTFGFGSQAGYDGTLNDAAVRQAVSEAVNRLSNELAGRPWQTAFLGAEGDRYFVAGGKAQGLKPGMEFTVFTKGAQVKSPQTGFLLTLPGREIGRLRIQSTFGDSEANEGSVATVVAGSLAGQKLEDLVIRSGEAR